MTWLRAYSFVKPLLCALSDMLTVLPTEITWPCHASPASITKAREMLTSRAPRNVNRDNTLNNLALALNW